MEVIFVLIFQTAKIHIFSELAKLTMNKGSGNVLIYEFANVSLGVCYYYRNMI